jgi:hypothetical protein
VPTLPTRDATLYATSYAPAGRYRCCHSGFLSSGDSNTLRTCRGSVNFKVLTCTKRTHARFAPAARISQAHEAPRTHLSARSDKPQAGSSEWPARVASPPLERMNFIGARRLSFNSSREAIETLCSTSSKTAVRGADLQTFPAGTLGRQPLTACPQLRPLTPVCGAS